MALLNQSLLNGGESVARPRGSESTLGSSSEVFLTVEIASNHTSDDDGLTEIDIIPFIIMYPSEIDHQTTAHGVGSGDTASMAPGDFVHVGPVAFPKNTSSKAQIAPIQKHHGEVTASTCWNRMESLPSGSKSSFPSSYKGRLEHVMQHGRRNQAPGCKFKTHCIDLLGVSTAKLQRHKTPWPWHYFLSRHVEARHCARWRDIL